MVLTMHTNTQNPKLINLMWHSWLKLLPKKHKIWLQYFQLVIFIRSDTL